MQAENLVLEVRVKSMDRPDLGTNPITATW